MLKLLILSPDKRTPGGVTNFIQVIFEKFSTKIKADQLFIGKNIDPEWKIVSFFKPIIDSIKLFKKIKNNHYDVVHINPSLNLKSVLRDGLFMLVINMSPSIKALVFFHGWEEKSAQFILKNKLLCFLMRMTYGKANKIVVLAEDFAKQLIDMGINKNQIILMSTMFDGSLFDGIEKKSDDKKTILLFMSRFVTGKGIMELLSAFNKIQKKHPELSLHLVGDGPEKIAIENKIINLNLQENVKLPGYIKGKEKAQELVNADIFILPSHSEGCPVSLLEAMAAGLPLITTAVGGIPDIITDGENGVLLTSHTSDAIEKGIEKMLENKIDRQKMGELNKKIAWGNYESKIVTSKVEKIYKQLSTVES